MTALKDQFLKDLHATLKETQNIAFGINKSVLERIGNSSSDPRGEGVAAAVKLTYIDYPDPLGYSTGLEKLVLKGKLDLSVEALMWDYRESNLFTQLELNHVKTRLENFGYKFAETLRSKRIKEFIATTGNSPVPISEITKPDEKEISNQGLPYGKSISRFGLDFGSLGEVAIAEVLDKLGVLYFANCKARLGKKDARKNLIPDFLICHKGKWAILEVDGSFHENKASEDHERDRVFDDYGVRTQRYDFDRCKSNPEEVVNDFLTRLERPY
jgi:Protein of unknown function (DUF559)